LEGGNHGLIEVLSWYFPGVTEGKPERPQDMRCLGRGTKRAPPKYGSRAVPLSQPAQPTLRELNFIPRMIPNNSVGRMHGFIMLM
jgi:hypothetical protein